ncbi:MAG: hypothetical protein QOF98_1246 [Streptomyces sp.]|nr:hypothetical protein [Streptomyces sp.]
MARITSGTLISGLVAAALIAVGALAADAAGSAPGYPLAAAGTSGGGAARPAPAPRESANPHDPRLLPADSGSGERVVYSLTRGRVWLVTEDEQVARTYPVTAGNLPPTLGAHLVFARRAQGEGGDGAAVEHVVLFAETDGMNIGFSAAVDGSLTPPDPTQQTTAVRQSRADAAALWQQATVGSTVEVVP